MIHTYSGENAELSFVDIYRYLQGKLINQPVVATGEWQSQDISNKPMLATHELANVSFNYLLPETREELATDTGAHLPWAEDHFNERVGGVPLNPSPSEAWWPFAQQGNLSHKSEGEAFSHTYPERIWPKHAPMERYNAVSDELKAEKFMARWGVRFTYGDLRDLVTQLKEGPLTRQAYLPIWFPEDTGAVHKKRVPCTLGYHFFIRNGSLQVTYYMRSCDFIRHFQDDVYMAGRLAQWVRDEINLSLATPVKTSQLVMHIVSLHCFRGDMAAMRNRHAYGKAWRLNEDL